MGTEATKRCVAVRVVFASTSGGRRLRSVQSKGDPHQQTAGMTLDPSRHPTPASSEVCPFGDFWLPSVRQPCVTVASRCEETNQLKVVGDRIKGGCATMCLFSTGGRTSFLLGGINVVQMGTNWSPLGYTMCLDVGVSWVSSHQPCINRTTQHHTPFYNMSATSKITAMASLAARHVLKPQSVRCAQSVMCRESCLASSSSLMAHTAQQSRPMVTSSTHFGSLQGGYDTSLHASYTSKLQSFGGSWFHLSTVSPSEYTDSRTPDDLDEGIPFRRSNTNADPNKQLKKSTLFDDRADAKLAALSTAKHEADVAKAAFLVHSQPEQSDASVSEELHFRWNQSEQQLAHAYSQAIKYTSRVLNNQEATATAEKLMYEWMARFTDSFDDGSITKKRNIQRNADEFSDVQDTVYVNKKRMVRTIHKVVAKLSSEDSSINEDDTLNLPTIHIPPPSSKDYINLLRAYSISKARRKGQQSEALIVNMLELARITSFYYNVDHPKWTQDRVNDFGMECDNKGVKKWISWTKENVPNSKAFALAIKCYAGSTRE
eukprot:scaffold996_cov190-Alexandrium_tamarense.AAC.13